MRTLAVGLAVAVGIGCGEGPDRAAGEDVSKRDAAADAASDRATGGSAGTGSSKDAALDAAPDASSNDAVADASSGSTDSGSADAIDVAAPTRDIVWVLGPPGVVLHGDGSSFRAVPTGTDARLEDVWGLAGNDVWAVGARGTILHWDGVAWSPVPSGADKTLRKLWGSGPSDVWVLGDGVILHWNGSAWSVETFPTPPADFRLWAATATGPRDIWACGQTRQEAPTIYHYDGTTLTGLREDPGIDLKCTTMHASAPDDVWAGMYIGIDLTGWLAHWDGSTWKGVGDGPFGFIKHIWRDDLQGLWAIALPDPVGRDNWVWQWDARAGWRHHNFGIGPGPEPGLGIQLSSGSAHSSQDSWVVGNDTDNPDAGYTGRIFRGSGHMWTPFPSGTSANLYRVWALPGVHPPSNTPADARAD